MINVSIDANLFIEFVSSSDSIAASSKFIDTPTSEKAVKNTNCQSPTFITLRRQI